MLPTTLRVTLCVAIIIYFVLILYFLKKKALELKYTLLWMLAGTVLALCVFFPEVLYWFIRFLGIESMMNGLYVICIGFMIMLLMSLTSIVSRQAFKIRSLVQDNALLEKRIRELEKVVLNDENNEI